MLELVEELMMVVRVIMPKLTIGHFGDGIEWQQINKSTVINKEAD